MKRTRVNILRQACGAWLMIAAAPLVGAQTPSSAPTTPPATAPAPLETAAAPSADQVGYLFGLTFGEQMHGVGIADQVSVDAIARGLKDGLQGKRSTPADRQQVQEFVRKTMEAAIARISS